MRISDLADKVGVPVSTVRYYERIGLLDEPDRTRSGYREYDDAAATQLLFIARARKLGLTCEQVAALLPVWGGSNCTSTHAEVSRLIEDKQVEIAARIKELAAFADELDSVRSILESSQPPHACRTDLACCLPAGQDGFLPLDGIAAALGDHLHARQTVRPG